MLITLDKISGVLFCLLGTNGFRVKAKKERFTAASSRCRQNLKYENFPASFGSTIIFLHLTNQIIDLWRCRWLCRRQILRTFAPKSSYGEIFFISPLELVDKVLTPKMKKKMGVTDFVSEKMAVEKCLNFDKSVIIKRCSLLLLIHRKS